MSKITQYATIDDKVLKDLGVVNIKFIQSSLQAYITWPKESSMLIILVLALQTFIGCAYVL
jgi:sensor histidine kinase regulating citrate/malate metabolism